MAKGSDAFQSAHYTDGWLIISLLCDSVSLKANHMEKITTLIEFVD